MFMIMVNGSEHLGGGIRKMQKTRCAKNAPRVQKNVDIHIIKIQQNVAAAEQTKNKKY